MQQLFWQILCMRGYLWCECSGSKIQGHARLGEDRMHTSSITILPQKWDIREDLWESWGTSLPFSLKVGRVIQEDRVWGGHFTLLLGDVTLPLDGTHAYIYDVNHRERNLMLWELVLLFNACSLCKGKIWGLLKEIRALCVSSSVSSKCGTVGLLKLLVALRPISCVIGSLAEFEPLGIASEGRGWKQAPR